MELDLQDYLKEISSVLIAEGFEEEVYAEVEGYKLCGYKRIREGEPLVYLSAGMHGDEPAGPLALLSAVKHGLLDCAVSFCICPMLNPTGMARGTRENKDGHDMNRDYMRLHSDEVKGHVKYLEGLKPELFLSLHEDWESTGYYFYEINTEEDNPAMYQSITDAVQKVMPLEPNSLIDDHEVREQGWIYHRAEADEYECWPEAIFMAKKNECPLSFTFESPSSLAMELRVKAHETVLFCVLEERYKCSNR